MSAPHYYGLRRPVPEGRRAIAAEIDRQRRYLANARITDYGWGMDLARANLRFLRDLQSATEESRVGMYLVRGDHAVAMSSNPGPAPTSHPWWYAVRFYYPSPLWITPLTRFRTESAARAHALIWTRSRGLGSRPLRFSRKIRSSAGGAS